MLTREKCRAGLEEIVKSSPTLFELQSMRKFASSVLMQLTSIVNAHKDAFHCSFAVTRGEEDIYILAASGDYEAYSGQKARDVVPKGILQAIEESFQRKQSFYGSSHLTIYFQRKWVWKMLFISAT